MEGGGGVNLSRGMRMSGLEWGWTKSTFNTYRHEVFRSSQVHFYESNETRLSALNVLFL